MDDEQKDDAWWLKNYGAVPSIRIIRSRDVFSFFTEEDLEMVRNLLEPVETSPDEEGAEAGESGEDVEPPHDR